MRTGKVWIVNFTPSVGDEIAKSRPAIVIDPDDIAGLKLRVIVPLTDANKLGRDWHVKIRPDASNNLIKESFADVLQLKSSSTERFIRKIGELSESDLDEIKLSIVQVLHLVL